MTLVLTLPPTFGNLDAIKTSIYPCFGANSSYIFPWSRYRYALNSCIFAYSTPYWDITVTDGLRKQYVFHSRWFKNRRLRNFSVFCLK